MPKVNGRYVSEKHEAFTSLSDEEKAKALAADAPAEPEEVNEDGVHDDSDSTDSRRLGGFSALLGQ